MTDLCLISPLISATSGTQPKQRGGERPGAGRPPAGISVRVHRVHYCKGCGRFVSKVYTGHDCPKVRRELARNGP
jgi:hypothetical protein